MYWVSIKALRDKCQKADYGYDVYPLMFRFFRVISIYFTWLLIQTRCKPNTITIYGALFGVLSGVFFFYNFVGTGLILAALAIIADFSDGEVSRFHGTTSKEGTYLDIIHHFVVQPFFIAGIVLWSFKENNNYSFLGAGLVCVINSIVLSLVITSAVEIAILKHLLRHIKKNGTSSKQIETITSQNIQIQKGPFYRNVPGILARMLDFPYVIVIFGIGAVLMNYGRDSIFTINGNLMIYMIYMYAFLSASMICVFIWNVVHSKHIEKRINEIIKIL